MSQPKRGNWNNRHDADNKKHYETTPTRKLLGAYGGVGSLVEMREGCFEVRPIDEWDFFREKHHEDTNCHIEDQRLWERLRTFFPNLMALVAAPPNKLRYGKPEQSGETALAQIFPRWFFCPHCRILDTVDHWHRKWKEAFRANEKKRNNFFPPKCYRCSVGKREAELEQVRFVLTSPNGNIADVPWERWALAVMKNVAATDDSTDDDSHGDEKRRTTKLDWTKELPDNYYLQYVASDKFNNLTGISIVARRPLGDAPTPENDFDPKLEHDPRIAQETLEGVFGLRVEEWLVLPQVYPNRSQMKVVIRSSNSVYYPNLLQSLFLPQNNGLPKPEVVGKIKNFHLHGLAPELISSLLKGEGTDVSASQIEQLIAPEVASQIEAPQQETAFRQGEYRFLTSKTGRYEDPQGRLIFESVPAELFNLPGVARVLRVDRLKMTVVQTSYTRQEPLDRDAFLVDDGDVRTRDRQVLRKKYISKYSPANTHYLPAVENYGEGIFFELDKTALDNWLNEHREKLEAKTGIIQKNFDDTKINPREIRCADPTLVLVHTFSHLIMKELEFLCGYPATSLQERLYISPEMQGVLIYVVAGAEGSYGGLVSLCKSDKIGRLLRSALHRATDCASDPICWEAEGQGVGGTNLAACFSCALLPETTCEEFNRFLDRRLVVDSEFGFFR